MIKKITFGNPFDTESVIKDIPSEKDFSFFPGNFTDISSFEWNYQLEENDIVYGLGEVMKGMNLRGGKYVSWCLDQPNQDENTPSLYGAHNFIIIFSKNPFAVYFDYPGQMEFDIGFTLQNVLKVSTEKKSMNIYLITPESAESQNQNDNQNDNESQNQKGHRLSSLVHQFRNLTGQSYIPPKWAFGFMQSRWGYKNQNDIDTVIQNHKKNSLPLDSVCMDIDYMEDYKDFTVDEKKFPNFSDYVKKIRKNGIRLVPIIDAGIKKQDGYDVYEQGKPFFCKEIDGKEFVAGVWPGDSVFPDFLNKDARDFFGANYKKLTDLGIEGFWNDMNEPAVFYSKKSLQNAFNQIEKYKNKQLDIQSFFAFSGLSSSSFNRKDDTMLFYHKVSQKTAGDFAATRPDEDGNVLVQNYQVHNIFGFNMTRAASESFLKENPKERKLLFSRSSYVGAHRYGGIWTGDNHSYWSNILLSLHMMANLNMTGFLYSGSDIGGFSSDTSRDLLLRWLAFGIFTPLCRNHSADGTRLQEFYQFENVSDFKSMLDLRYALLPFLYSEFVKAAKTNKMYFRPLSFDYEDDSRALHTEDQILLGESLMIAPVYVKNAIGRNVYLPEDMLMIEWKNSQVVSQKTLQKGDYFIDVPLTSVVFFIKKGKIVPFAKPALNSAEIDTNNLTVYGDAPEGTVYELYEDDGFTTDIDLQKGIRKIEKHSAKF